MGTPRERAEPVWTVLRWGFAGTIALALAVSAVSMLEIQRARRDVERLARTADRSSFLVGEIGRHMNRMRAIALERVLEPEADASTRMEAYAAASSALDRVLVELEPLLQPHERPRWRRFLPLLASLRARLADALASLAENEGAAEAVVLAEVGPLAADVQAELDALGLLNQEESDALLAASDRRLARMRLIQTSLDLALVLGLVPLWWVVLRVLARQRRELAEYVERVERSNLDLDAFAGRVAHDLRNALAPFTLIAGLLRTSPHRPETAEQVAAQLERAVNRSRSLIDGLLAFSRAVGVEPSAARASLAAAVRDAVEELAPLASRVSAALDLEVRDAEVRCPPSLLHVVAANLIGNAIKFLHERPLRRVTVTTGIAGDRAELVVADTGPGIPAAALPRIFEPFYRAPGASAAGTGIGLATARRIVAEHGGEITVESQLGVGTRFVVRLPLARSDRAGTGAIPIGSTA